MTQSPHFMERFVSIADDFSGVWGVGTVEDLALNDGFQLFPGDLALVRAGHVTVQFLAIGSWKKLCFLLNLNFLKIFLKIQLKNKLTWHHFQFIVIRSIEIFRI